MFLKVALTRLTCFAFRFPPSEMNETVKKKIKEAHYNKKVNFDEQKI